MKLVFDHIDFTIVGHMQSVLEAEGIRTEIRNEGASRAAGELPISEVYPELWVLDNADEARAKALIREFRQAGPVPPLARTGRARCARNTSRASFPNAGTAARPLRTARSPEVVKLGLATSTH
jgi:hypothetical protein